MLLMVPLLVSAPMEPLLTMPAAWVEALALTTPPLFNVLMVPLLLMPAILPPMVPLLLSVPKLPLAATPVKPPEMVPDDVTERSPLVQMLGPVVGPLTCAIAACDMTARAAVKASVRAFCLGRWSTCSFIRGNPRWWLLAGYSRFTRAGQARLCPFQNWSAIARVSIRENDTFFLKCSTPSGISA